MNFNLKYFSLFILIFFIEVLIALFATGFLRHFIGDVLVILLIYFFIKSWWNSKNNFKLILGVFIFALVIEILQLFNIPEILQIKNKIVQVVLGSTFDWLDILAYAIGSSILIGLEKKPTT